MRDEGHDLERVSFGKRARAQTPRWEHEPIEPAVVSGGGWPSPLTLAAGFAAVAMLAAVALPPVLGELGERVADARLGVSPISTATVPDARPRTSRYTVRRSVLSDNYAEPCVIYENGRTEGSC